MPGRAVLPVLGTGLEGFKALVSIARISGALVEPSAHAPSSSQPPGSIIGGSLPADDSELSERREAGVHSADNRCVMNPLTSGSSQSGGDLHSCSTTISLVTLARSVAGIPIVGRGEEFLLTQQRQCQVGCVRTGACSSN